MPASPYFDPSQLSATTTPDWTRLNNAPAQHSPIPQPQQTQQQSLQISPIGQNSWSSLVSPSLQTIVDDRTLLPTVLSPALPQPIGPPLSQQNSPKIDVVEASVPIVSPWASIGKALDDYPIAQEVPRIATLPPPPPAVVFEAPVVAKPAPVARVQKVEPVATLVLPTPVVVAATPAKSPTAAPWIKDDSRPASPVGPSLRQIQELESRQAELRKAAERQVAANNKAIAAVQAAQRAAAAEAESLPSSSTWAAGASASGSIAAPATPAPRTVARSATYDADSPPPPSAEFMKWCRDALKGLNVPNCQSFHLPTTSEAY